MKYYNGNEGAIEVFSTAVDELIKLVKPEDKMRLLELIAVIVNEIDAETLKIWTSGEKR